MGYQAAQGLSATADLNGVLDYLASHPNTAPFISKQLIQHLVKSNPSAAYLLRVSPAFTQSKGDMPTVISAILLDPEARANDAGGNDQPTDGHLQEPAIFIPAMIRAFNGQMNDQSYYQGDLANMGEDIFDSPSVFNFFVPDYEVPGAMVAGGEFQIDTPNNAILRANEVATLVYSQYNNPIQSYGPGTSIDLTPFVSLVSSPSTLINALDLTLTHGVMPATMKSEILSAVNADSDYGPIHQIQTACYLILSSYYYNVWH